MGATDMMYTIAADSIEHAYQRLLNVLDVDIEDETWEDPKNKPGFVQVWDKPVTPEDAEILARAIMTGRVDSNEWSEAERTSNMPKFGPWYVIRLKTDHGGGLPSNYAWLFFGWVNT